ncbi:MAG TPA: nicotinate-nucleotide adenylyltransferase [Spirochaetia bacterium]|nr:nicotinate-nucleotide adenylyltransferase [Spirochaetia bacterium]
MRAVILGGTFNPVHYGHLFIAEEVRSTLGYDAVIFVPANQPVHKDTTPVVDPAHRLSMLRIAVADNPRFIVDTGDIDRGGPSYSIETVTSLVPRHGIEGRPGFLIGDDLAAGFSSWKNVDALVAIVDLIVARRTGPAAPALGYAHRVLPNAVLPISSSDIRRRFREGRAVRYLLPDPVLSYIRDHALYG